MNEQENMSASQMINRVKELLGVESDYAFEQRLGLKPSAVQQLRRNGGNTAPWKMLAAVLALRCQQQSPDKP